MGYELVVVGASWGGLAALRAVLKGLPADFELPIVVAQHRAADSIAIGPLVQPESPLPVVDAQDKDELEPGHVYLAPADYHLFVEPGSLALSIDERVKWSRPSVDVLFESAADSYGGAVVGVLLTGANEDGVAGMVRIRQRGGFTVAQDPATAESPAMPQAAIDAGAADAVVALADIPSLLVDLCGGR